MRNPLSIKGKNPAHVLVFHSFSHSNNRTYKNPDSLGASYCLKVKVHSETDSDQNETDLIKQSKNSCAGTEKM